MKHALAACLCAVALAACKKDSQKQATPGAPKKTLTVGLVTDVGGRGDHSFNDAALRGLEQWAGGKRYTGGRYEDLAAAELHASLPADLRARDPQITSLGVRPLVLQSKAQEDYEPNLQMLVDQGADLVIGTGFMLENAIEAVAKRNPKTRFLLIDSRLLDESGKFYRLPNVRTVVFKEEEGSLLVGALAGLATQSGKVAFVGGMEIPLIKRFEVGFRAGVAMTNATASKNVLTNYTGSFDKVAAGKQVAEDLIARGADIVFHAAGTDGLGVIRAVQEARGRGKNIFVIGVDSDQWHLAKDAVLSSMVKRIDLAVYEAIHSLINDRFDASDATWGLKEGGVTYAEIRLDLPNKAELIQRLEALRQRVVSGELKVPATLPELASFRAE